MCFGRCFLGRELNAKKNNVLLSLCFCVFAYWRCIVFLFINTSLFAYTPGEEVVYTFPINSDKQVISAPQAVCDDINLIMRSDVEIHAALQTNAIGVAVVGQKQGLIPLSFGPFYMRNNASVALNPEWLSQMSLAIDSPLEPLIAPSKFLLPIGQVTIGLETHNLVVKEAKVDNEKMERFFIFKKRLWDAVLFLSLALLVSITAAPLYLFYRSRYPVQITPILPHWSDELNKIASMPVDKGSIQLHTVLCSYLAWKLGVSSGGKTLRDFLPQLAGSLGENVHVWQHLNEILEKVLYGKQETLFHEALISSRQVIQTHQ